MPLPSLTKVKSETIAPNNKIEYLENYFKPCESGESGVYYNHWVESGWIGLFNLDLILSTAIQENSSDIHIIGGQEICFTILGEIKKRPDFGVPDEDVMSDLVMGILSHQAQGVYVKEFEYDSSYVVRFGPYRGRRFRVNIGKSFDKDQMTFRTISDDIPHPQELGIDNELLSWFNSSSGVILTCGATGSGKTTSLASIIRDIQIKKRKKIVTIEKPIEYIYPTDGQSLIVQRAIPEDCLSFSSGLTSAMRSAPNIILIGEVRNREEVDELLRSSETGHLSLSTIHSSNNITTLNRMRSLYTGDEQRRILSTLSDNLRGIVNQVLVKALDGQSRYAVREMLKVDYEIKKLISEDKLPEIRVLQEERGETLEHKLVKEVLTEKCSLNEARTKAPDPSYFDFILKK